jgi:hypothetical protein
MPGQVYGRQKIIAVIARVKIDLLEKKIPLISPPGFGATLFP